MLRHLIILAAAMHLTGCATAMVTGAVVGTATKATSLAVKGTIGATKLAYRGTKAAVSGTARLMRDDEPEDPSFDED